jgi:hypothetical protein
MLTADDAARIARDVMEDRPAADEGPEAEEFRAAFRRDLALAEKNGWVIEMPFEIHGAGPAAAGVANAAAEWYPFEV